MNKEDILSAAFRAWGREGYRKTSLSAVAAELGVTKPALYRHFRDKEVLFGAMSDAFFDRYAAMLAAADLNGFSLAARDDGALLRYAETLALYFGARRDDLAFLFGRVMTSDEPHVLFARALAARGVLLPKRDDETEEQRIRLEFVLPTSFFLVALFHLSRKGSAAEPSAAEIRALADAVRAVCARGLAFPADELGDSGFGRLDDLARLDASETAAADGLLPAVAAAVAEVGSWRASMDRVAKKAGLSKSGLYAHFSSKDEMLARTFKTEFGRIAAAVEKRCALLERSADRLYVSEATVAEFLTARPDLLVALDWVRVQRIDLGDLLPDNVDRTFSFLKEEAADGRCRLLPGGFAETVRWIFFLTVHQLVAPGCAAGPAGVRRDRLRALHRFFLRGLGE